MKRKWKVHISLESRKLRISADTIRAITLKTLTQVEDEIALLNVRELHIMLINDAKMREINFEFRHKDKATDVLSFPQFTKDEIRGKKPTITADGHYLGDLVISTETTLAQSKTFGVTPRQELIRLIIHGILHLIGYDHEKVSAVEAQRMRRKERQLRLAF